MTCPKPWVNCPLAAWTSQEKLPPTGPAEEQDGAVPAVVWLLAAVALCAAEMLTLDLVLLMLGVAALVTAGAALVLDPLSLQIAETP